MTSSNAWFEREGAAIVPPPTHLPAPNRLVIEPPRGWRALDLSELWQYRELLWPRDAALESWAVRVRQAVAEHPRIFVAVSNHYEGFAPHTARRLGSRLGFDFPAPEDDPANKATGGDGRQMDLL